MATSISGGGSRSTRREPPTLGKQLVNSITLLTLSTDKWGQINFSALSFINNCIIYYLGAVKLNYK